MRTSVHGFLLAALVALPACVDGAADNDATDDGSVATSAYFGTNWAFTVVTNVNKSVDLGPVAGRTCFLSGIAGRFTSEIEGGATIRSDGTEYSLDIDPADGPIKVSARCASGEGTLEVFRRVENAGSDIVIAPATTGRRCFLTGIDWHRERFGPFGFDSADSEIAIVNDGVNWVFPASATGRSTPANAHARCVDGTDNVGAVSLTAATHGTSTVPLPTGGGMNCGLQDIRGAFADDDTTDGVVVAKDAAGDLTLTATNGKHVVAGCQR